MTLAPFTPFTPFTALGDRSKCTKEVSLIALKLSLVLWQEAFRAKGVGSHRVGSYSVDKARRRRCFGLGEYLKQASQPLAAPLANTVLAVL